MLLSLICLPFIGALVLLFIKEENTSIIKNFSLFWSLFIFNYSLIFFIFFDNLSLHFQYLQRIEWLHLSNINIVFGLDSLGLYMILLTTFLIPICILLSWNDSLKNDTKFYNISFFLLEAILLGVFSSLDILVFYVLFEAVLIPMYFIVGSFGSRERRIRASYMLFLYTLISSVFMFIAILFIYNQTGTTDYMILRTVELGVNIERFCWFAFFLSFAVKMPLVPFHVWLPEAHCEAPTAGSVILAGILLKLGGFGFLRYSLGLFPDSSAFFAPLIFTISCFGVVYASITTLQQVDLKKIIAYSSVGHMGLVTIGIFSMNMQGILGSILLMISHGIVSSALFICIGILYERHHTRVLKYYSGLIHTMPLFSVSFIIFTLGNIGLPGTSSFIGEFLILLGAFSVNNVVALISGTGMILGAGYSLWTCNRMLFGNIKLYSIQQFRDLNRFEFCMLLPFILLVFIIGLYPEIIINIMKCNLHIL